MRNETIYIGTSIWKTILFVLVCLLFVVGGVYIYELSDDLFVRLIGIVSVFFFGIGCLFLVYHYVIDRRPRIIIDEQGVNDRTLYVGRIEWTDIEEIELRSVHKSQFVMLKLRNSRKYSDRLSRARRFASRSNKALGFGELNLNLSLINIAPEEVYSIIQDRIAAGEGTQRQ